MVRRFARAMAAVVVASGCGGVTMFAAAPAGAAAVASHVAGYSAAPNASATQSARITFVVPTLNCGSVPSGGFQGVIAGARLRITGGSTAVGVALVCPGPVASYGAALQVNGVPIGSALTIKPRDRVTVSATEGPTGASVTITDGAQSQTATGSGGTVSAEDVGMLAVNCGGTPSCSPVPQVTLTRFTGASIDGTNLRGAHAVLQKLVDASGTTEMMSTRASTVSHSSAFAVRWLTSCSTGPGTC